MHWLHVNPNSDFSTFPHFFSTFSADFCQVFLQNLSQNSEEKQKPNSKSLPNTSFFPNMCRNFAKKMLKVCQVQIIFWKNDKCQRFQYFFGKISAKYLQKTEQNSSKKVPKKCRKVEKSEFGFTCSQCIIVETLGHLQYKQEVFTEVAFSKATSIGRSARKNLPPSRKNGWNVALLPIRGDECRRSCSGATC